MTHCPRCGKKNVDPIFPHTCTPPRALALAEQPAEQEWDGSCVMGHCGSPSGCEIDGYCRVDRCSAPPPRREVTLTDEEIDALPWEPSYDNPMTLTEGLREFARAIIAAYKAKQGEKT